jgi:hypothetical protein
MRRGHLTKEHGGAVEYLQGLQYQIITYCKLAIQNPWMANLQSQSSEF